MTTKTYDGQTARFLASVATCMPALSGDVMQGWIDNPRGLKNFLSGLAQKKEEESLLEFLGGVTVPATTTQFVAKEKFICDTGRKAKVKISNLDGNFTEWFLLGSGKTEDPISEQTLRYHKLRQSSADGPIIAELGGEVKAETTLPEMFSLMERQRRGEDGVLLNNGGVNIFYIKDVAGVLCTVYVGWDDGGWSVGAAVVSSSDMWSDGEQVFSRI